MRISDWSSDVCSSDLLLFADLSANGLNWSAPACRKTYDFRQGSLRPYSVIPTYSLDVRQTLSLCSTVREPESGGFPSGPALAYIWVRSMYRPLSTVLDDLEIGRASCRERVWH